MLSANQVITLIFGIHVVTKLKKKATFNKPPQNCGKCVNVFRKFLYLNSNYAKIL